MASKDRGLTPIELSSFCSEIALMLGAGMPLYAGMEALEKTYEQDAHADLYHKVSETLTQTGSLRDALEETHAFPTYLVEMCGIGERTGHLEDVMQGLSAYYERESRIRQAVRSAVTYPLVLSVMMVLILMVLILKVMPVFRRVLGSMGVAMTATGSMMMNVGTVIGWVVLALVLGVSVSAFAAGAPKSQEQRLVPINGEVAPGDYVGWTEDKDGNFIDYVNEKDVDFAELEEHPNGLKEKVDEVQDRLGDDKQLTVSKIFELELDENHSSILDEGGSVTIRFLTELKDGETLHVLHQLPDGTWEEITGSRLHFNDDGTVDIKFYNLGYVVFAVSTNRVSAADAATSTSPKTGRPLYPFWLLAAAAALAAGTAIMVAVLPKRKKN